MESFELALGSLERGGQLSVLEADISSVSAQISDAKAKARTVRFEERRRVDGQLRELKGLATLLCAIRAHARGNVHVKGTLARQERYIQERSTKYEGHGSLKAMPARYLQNHDTILTDGDAVVVIGVASLEPDPHGVAGYRDQPLRTVIRAPEDGMLEVSGEGAEAASEALAVGVSDASGLTTPAQGGRVFSDISPATMRIAAAVAMALAVVAFKLC